MKAFWLWLMAAFFVAAGVNHFLHPQPYLAMMPGYLPTPVALNWISGVAEILGGIGILMRRFRPVAAWGLIALLLAVFPANVHVALHGWPGVDLPRWVLWLRLPFQPVLIWCVYRVCLAGSPAVHRRPPAASRDR